MLRYRHAFSGFSTNDIEAARRFYGDILGVDVEEANGMLTLRLSGGQAVLIYPKPDHAPATYTALNFEVEDIEASVDDLLASGISFERYGAESGQDERGIARGWGPPIAWFKDPAGNILSVIQSGREEA